MSRRCLLVTPRTQQAHRQLYGAVDALADVVLELAPRSLALADVAARLDAIAGEYREWAATCAEGEALVLEFTPPACEYWIFQLCNVWQENLDNYEDGQGYVTKFTARPDAAGVVRIVVATADPAIGGNWVDPFGHVSGLMGLRFIKTADIPDVKVYRVALADLRKRAWDALESGRAIRSEVVE